MEIDLNQFRSTFFQEAAEHLETMESALLGLEAGQGDDETLHAIFRCAHSIKAGAGTFGFEAMGRFTHTLETVLDRMRNAETQASAGLLKLLLRSVDVLRALVDNAAAGKEEKLPEMETLLGELGGSNAAGQAKPAEGVRPAAGAPPEQEYAIHFQPEPQVFQMGLDPLLVLRELARLGRLISIEPELSRVPPLAELDPSACFLGWRLRLSTAAEMAEIRDVFAFVEDVATLAIQPLERPAASQDAPRPVAVHQATARETSIRVSTEKVDRLIDLAGELVIAQSMAAQIMNDFTPSRLAALAEAMAEIERYTRELQERVMRIRMLPVGSVFSRFPRLVRDTAQSLGKQVALEIEGEETELDKGVVERLVDPLTHLVRNAVDHGIELPEARQASGKPEQGNLRLSARHQGGNVILEIADDGRGLDSARIRAKAVQQGLVAADDDLSPERVHALIFRPGFSTVETVSNLSGRGVGMDVVKSGVEAMNGTVAVETEPGRGTTFRIKLPLTLAILDGLLLKLGDQTYVLPMASIVESIRPRGEQVRDMAGRGEVVVVRKDPLPLVRMHRLFNVPGAVTDPTRGLAVIVEHENRQLALLVDEVLGQQQVVVKSLETNFRKVEGITGATVLGDGRAALILDVSGIADLARAAARAAAA